MAVREDVPSIDYLFECFDLNETTGILTWRFRPCSHFTSEHGMRTTNGRMAGKTAGSATTKGYIQVEIEGVAFKAHRVVFAMAYGKWPDEDIDHINGDPTDNRPINLREATGQENMANKGVYARNISGEPNISHRPQTYLKKRWHVQIVASGVKHQAYFETQEAARSWRDAKRIELGFHPNHGQRPGYGKSKQGISS